MEGRRKSGKKERNNKCREGEKQERRKGRRQNWTDGRSKRRVKEGCLEREKAGRSEWKVE